LTTLRKGFADKTALDQATAIETANALRHSLMRESITEDLVILEEKYQAEREALQTNELISSEEKIVLMNEILEREEMEEALIRKKWDDIEIADEKKKADEKIAIRKAVLDTTIAGLQSMSDLNSLVSDIAMNRAEGDQKKQEQIQRRAFNINKALQLGIATVSGYLAVQSAYQTGLASPVTAVNPAYPFIQAGLAGLNSAVNIAKIASAKFKGGAGSMPKPSSGGAGASAGASASSFAISDDTSSVQTQLNADGTQAGANGQTQVVVVETDITTAVNNVAQINEVSTF